MKQINTENGKRIKELVATIGSIGKFSELIGVQYSTIHDWIKNGRMSMGCITAIHRAFPWVSLNWLIFGEGEKVCDYQDYKEHKEFLLEMRRQLDNRINKISHTNEY